MATTVGIHFLLQGVFLTQGLNPGILHYKQILFHLRAAREAPPPKKKKKPTLNHFQLEKHILGDSRHLEATRKPLAQGRKCIAVSGIISY